MDMQHTDEIVLDPNELLQFLGQLHSWLLGQLGEKQIAASTC